MANFAHYEPLLKQIEGYGKYTNLSTDKGGPTMSGVTLTTFRAHYGANKTIADLKAMTAEQWRTIMKRSYWDRASADKIANQAIAELIVDFCVNSGSGMLKRVQALLGVTADGIIGPKSLLAINSAPQQLLFNAIMAERKNKYYEIVNASPSQKANLNGWMNRLAKFRFS